MGFISHKLNPRDAKPGDHVYVNRMGISYAHHGIVVVGGTDCMVVHLSSNKWISCSSSSSSSSSESTHACGYRKAGSGVAMTCLDCFTKGDTLRRYKYGVSTAVFISKIKPGTCSTAKADPPEEVIRRAKYLLDTGFGNCNLFTNNCEVFAQYCKTGLIICGADASSQVVSAAALPVVVLVGAVAGLGAALATHNFIRYKQDIGVRKDAIEVAVEELEAYAYRLDLTS